MPSEWMNFARSAPERKMVDADVDGWTAYRVAALEVAKEASRMVCTRGRRAGVRSRGETAGERETEVSHELSRSRST